MEGDEQAAQSYCMDVSYVILIIIGLRNYRRWPYNRYNVKFAYFIQYLLILAEYQKQ